MSMDSNTLTVKSSWEDLSSFIGSSHLYAVRIEVTNGAKLSWQTSAHFHGTTNDTVNASGGGVFVGEGSTVRFLNNLEMTDVGVLSVPDKGSDFASYNISGGCVYADGYFRVDGDTTFTNCKVGGGGGGGGRRKSGCGGVLYVGEQGSVLFSGRLGISGVYIVEDEGSNRGGIYNKGKVNIKGDAVFENLGAINGGALYNVAGSQFRFKNQATALFIDCASYGGITDGISGGLYNNGYFKISGPALFVRTGAPSVYVASEGETVLSKKSMIWDNTDTGYPAILSSLEARLASPARCRL